MKTVRTVLKDWNFLILLAVVLSVVSLFIEQADLTGIGSLIFTNAIDTVILLILVWEIAAGLTQAPYKSIYIRRNLESLVFSLIFVVLFFYTKYITYIGFPGASRLSESAALAVRNFFLVLKVLSRYRRIATILESLRIRPAMTILLSFLVVILAGTWLLMMPFTAESGPGLSFVDAMFTATSAVCVTGLIVVDTAVHFSIWGQVVLMLLIQIGGLGIMVLSYFTIFVLRRRVTMEQKSLASYMLSEDDMTNLAGVLRSIVLITLSIELVGMGILAISWVELAWPERLLYGAFHAVSAFCNAGFSLFSDSLAGFAGRPAVLLTIAALITCGGLSFAVMMNLRDVLRSRITRRQNVRITLNTRIVLMATMALTGMGTVLLYPLEHGRALAGLNLGEQYLAAFFQSVTLRTAGFNSIAFDGLATGTLVLMMGLMFVGGASGSTAGGIKVNTMTVLLASIRSAWRNDDKVVIRSHTVDSTAVNRSYLILLFGLMAVISGTFLLSLSEEAPLRDLVFESVSAFATVGLSTGITAALSAFGKTIIILLMFIGRLGPLTVLAAASRESGNIRIDYPRANIAIG